MNIKNEYPAYEAVAEHIRRANAEHSVYIAHSFVDALVGAMRFVKRVAAPRRAQVREA